MLPATDDPFEILGVARDVDEKALKKRYFALMRTYPPETHPEEFSRIHEAYSKLSNPETRAELEQGGEFGSVKEPYRSRLREAAEQLRTNRTELAVTALDQIVQEEPTLREAREILQQVLLALGRPAEAEPHIRASIQQQPGQVGLHLRLADALRQQKRWLEALEQCDFARALSEGKATAPWRYGAELLMQLGRPTEAMERLEEGIAQVPDPAPLIMTRIFLRRHEIGLARLLPDLALLEASYPASATQEREELSQRLKSLAATFFHAEKPQLANKILELAAKLSGASTQAMVFPARVELFIDELPAASQAWLEEERKQPHIFHLPGRAFEAEIIVALGAAVAGGLAIGGMLLSETSLGFFWPLLALLIGAMLAGAWALDRLASARGGPLSKVTAVHPLYFLQIGRDQVTAYPLLNLLSASGLHMHRNGVYLNTKVELRFPEATVKLTVQGQEQAEQLIALLNGYRDRALDLLSSGLFDADRDFQLIPAALLDVGRSSEHHGRRQQQTKRRFALAAGLSAVGAVIGLFATSAHTTDLRWAAVLNTQTIPALIEALDAAPGEAARAEATNYLARRRADLGPTLAPPPGTVDHRERAARVMGALDGAPRPRLELRWSAGAALASAPFVAGFNDALSRRAAKVITLGTPAGLPVEVEARSVPSGQRLLRGSETFELPSLQLEVKVAGLSLPVEVRLRAEDIEALPPERAIEAATTEALLAKAGRSVALELGLSGLLAGR